VRERDTEEAGHGGWLQEAGCRWEMVEFKTMELYWCSL